MAVGDGTPGPGRPKGSRNKTTQEAKEIIAEAASRLGGVERLIAWARDNEQNERIFWGSMFPKLLPLQVRGSHDVNVVDRTEMLRRAREEVRSIFGEREEGGSAYVGSGSLPN